MFCFSFLFIGMEKQCSGVQKTTVPGPNNTRGAESKLPGVGGEKSTRLSKIGEIGVDLNMGGGGKLGALIIMGNAGCISSTAWGFGALRSKIFEVERFRAEVFWAQGVELTLNP